MPLAAGQVLSCYEILGHLGAGAMGEVYRARDMRLERDVAIKVIPEEIVDEDRTRRFEREARILASLNHPNIAAIYGVDRVGDVSFLALELVPGDDLAAMLRDGPLPLDEVVDICRQIAEGLEAAHEAGVVHRDLKPANVRVTPDGVVKILDFGLAKPARRPAAGAASRAGTDTVELSQDGLVLGTPTYMSPEQARGKAVDRRTDIWAFGCVLFECLTGARAYDGDGITEILAAVFEREWDRSALPAATPAHVRRLLERCLDKDPRQRLRDIGEARIVLAPGALDRPEASAVPPRRRPLVAAALAVLALGALAGRTWLAPTNDPRSVGIELRRLTEFAGTMEGSPAISPDGKVLAFVAPVDGRRQIWVRLMASGGAAEPVTDGPSEHSFPRWIDENRLVYFRHPATEGEPGSLWETLYAGRRRPRRICAAESEADVSHADGRIAMFDLDGSNLVIVDRNGKQTDPPRPLVPPSSGNETGNAKLWRGFSSPRWSHDDRYVAFVVRVDLAATDLRVMDLADGTTRTIASAGAMRGIAWLPDDSGFVLASSAGSTMTYPPEFRLRVVRIADGHETALPLASAGYVSYVEPDVSPLGQLVASRVAQDSDIYKYPIDGETPLDNVQRALRVTRQKGLVQVPSASPSGENEEVAYLSDNGGRANIWVARADGTGIPRQLTNEQDPDTVIGLPLWSPRGDLIAYYKQHRRGAAAQWLVQSDGFEPRRLAETGGGAAWSRDGKWLYTIATPRAGQSAVTAKIDVETGELVPVRSGALGIVVSSDGSTGYFSPTADADEVWKVTPVETGEPELLIGGLRSKIPLWPHHFALSPDDRWLATPLKENGTTNLFVISTADGTRRPITDFGRRPTMIARQVSWSGDSRFIFAALMETDADIVLLDGALDAR